MTQVHVLPPGETPEHHTLGNCTCGPRIRPRLRQDGSVIDHIHLHRRADDRDQSHPAGTPSVDDRRAALAIC